MLVSAVLITILYAACVVLVSLLVHAFRRPPAGPPARRTPAVPAPAPVPAPQKSSPLREATMPTTPITAITRRTTASVSDSSSQGQDQVSRLCRALQRSQMEDSPHHEQPATPPKHAAIPEFGVPLTPVDAAALAGVGQLPPLPIPVLFDLPEAPAAPPLEPAEPVLVGAGLRPDEPRDAAVAAAHGDGPPPSAPDWMPERTPECNPPSGPLNSDARHQHRESSHAYGSAGVRFAGEPLLFGRLVFVDEDAGLKEASASCSVPVFAAPAPLADAAAAVSGSREPQPRNGKAPAADFLAFYGLRAQPFDVTPDPAYLYLSHTHREALDALALGIEHLRGFMALVAEPGMGKTTLLHKLMEDLREKARVVFLFQTQCDSRELLAGVLAELGVDTTGMGLVAMHRTLNDMLFHEMLQGRRFVLIVDEAQNLDDSVLEMIRLLSDYETSHSKLLQIVLAGQPQLLDKLLNPGLVQLRQRIATLGGLQALSPAETSLYVNHRLHAAGAGDVPIFTDEALAVVAERSGGIPRNINNLCFHALAIGRAQQQRTIDAWVIDYAAGQCDFESFAGPRLEQSGTPDSSTEHTDAVPSGTAELAQALLAALAATQSRLGAPEAKAPQSSITLSGKLIERRTSRGWSDRGEARIQVSLERGAADLSVAERYYCCNFFVDHKLAAVLHPGQPVRIRIEQD